MHHLTWFDGEEGVNKMETDVVAVVTLYSEEKQKQEAERDAVTMV